MQKLNQEGQRAVREIAERYELSPETVEHMLNAVSKGAGSMAQFNCPELGGSGQWMRGGMTMVGDMFNHRLKSVVDSLCNELSSLLAATEVFSASSTESAGYDQWWAGDLGKPLSRGSQNTIRYAVFPDRLAVDVGGEVTVYDTLDHQIGGVSQQQGGGTSLSFSSQHGTVAIDSLPVVSGAGSARKPNTNFAASHHSETAPKSPGQSVTVPEPEAHKPDASEGVDEGAPVVGTGKARAHSGNDQSGNEILTMIEKLAQLHSAGVLTDEEFSAKKSELLGRI